MLIGGVVRGTIERIQKRKFSIPQVLQDFEGLILKVRPSGIEPDSPRWQRSVLPINYGRVIKRARDVI